MILGILGLFLKALPGPILDYLARKAESENEALSIRAKSEQHKREMQRDIVLKEGDHWIAWLPRFMISFAVALYILAIFLVSIFQIPWAVLQVPSAMETVMDIVIAALFIEKTVRIAKR